MKWLRALLWGLLWWAMLCFLIIVIRSTWGLIFHTAEGRPSAAPGPLTWLLCAAALPYGLWLGYRKVRPRSIRITCPMCGHETMRTSIAGENVCPHCRRLVVMK